MKVIRGIEEIPSLHKAVITIGSFDGIHIGHQKIFNRLKSIASQIGGVSLIITFHPHPRQVIYPKDNSLELITPVDEKMELLSGLSIDYCLLIPFTIEFSQLNPRDYIENFLIKKIKPAYVVIGYDHQFGLNREGNFDLLKQYVSPETFQLVKIEKQEMENIAISSSKIREAIKHGYVGKANELLGHSFSLFGKVVSGDKIGRTLDYPTANLLLDSELKIKPKGGIYAAETVYKNEVYPSMLYIGDRPSIESQNESVINYEVHLLDYSGDLYDKDVQVKLLKYIRDDQKYDTKDNLIAAIQNDEKVIRSYFDSKPKPLSQKKINIAILNYNGSHYLESFLPFLHDSHSQGQEITVIDNQSSDDSIHLLQNWFPEVKVVQLEKNFGFAKGYNVGLTGLSEKYIVLLNSDIQVTDNWLDPIISMMDSDPTIGIVQPKIKSLEEKEKFEYAGAAGGFMDIAGYPFCRGRIFDAIESDNNQYDDNIDIFWASGAAMVIRNSLWQGLNGFDDSYFAHQEEIDLCWRAKRAGFKIMYCGSSEVYHLGGGTLGYENPKKVYLNFKNNLKTIFKNNRFGKLLWLMPLRLILDFIAGLKFLASGNYKSMFAIIKAYASFVGSISKTIQSRSDNDKAIKAIKIGEYNHTGYYPKFILVSHFLKGMKHFSNLKF